jgi:Na+/H+ antiporter NhaD/arsenite permease-like protein
LKEKLGLPLAPLLWTLAYGTCLGGNGTLIGASANVVTVGIANANGIDISYIRFLKIGFPIMILSCLTVTIYLLITHVWWAWY